MRQNLIRLLIFSLVLFSTGVVIGWWLHLRWPPMEAIRPYSPHSFGTIESLFTPEQQPLVSPHTDILEFNQMLEEGRYDDALTIYQRHESNDSPLSAQLRTALLDKLEDWTKTKLQALVISTLERFTDYYYQDIELLKMLALGYEADQQLDKSIETYINIQPYTYQQDELTFLSQRIHSLSNQLYEKHKKLLSIETLIPLFQKLAYLEPDHAFYRFVLAQSYIAATDNNSAIRELEMLQLDPDFGDKASRMLAELLPPPPPPEDPGEPSNVIPLSGKGGHYVVNAVTGEKYGVRLLIDTGATLTTFPSRILIELRKRELATRIAHVELKTANGTRLASVYRVKEFQIGNYKLSNLEVAELELGSNNSDGLLGMNVLSQFHFFIDQNRQTLSLSPR